MLEEDSNCTHQERQICQTPACFEVADKLKNSIDQNINPCDNFYAYACGNWHKTHVKDMELWPTGNKAIRSEENILELRNFLESPNNSEEPQSVHNARRLYSLCMDTEKLDKQGLQPLKDILTKVGLSSDPPLNRNSINFDLFSTLIKLQKYIGINPFFKISVAPDPYNRTINRATIRRHEPEKYSLFPVRDQKQMKVILTSVPIDYILQISRAICGNSESEICTILANLTDGLGAAIAFNPLIDYLRETYKLFMEKDYTSVPQIFTLEELQKFTDDIAYEMKTKTPTIDWFQFFSLYFADVDNLILDKNFKVVVRNPNNLKSAFSFIYSNGSELADGLTTLELGLWWDVVHSLALLSANPIRNIAEKFIVDFSNREKYCVNIVKKNLGRAISYYYMTNSTYRDIKKEISKMISNLDFKSVITGTVWMDNKTKEKAIQKLEALRILLVNPEKFIESRRQRHVPSMLIAPAGILGMWKINSSLNAFNYGSLGSLIASEILHTFDYLGKQYNSKGNIDNWWEQKTLNEFKKQEQCFTHNSSNVNGQESEKFDSTTTDHVALIVGFKQALLAYKKYLKKTGDEILLPQFENLTNDQLFTLGFANIWCENPAFITIENMKYLEYSSNSLLINKAVSQSEEFGGIWNCEKGSPMNPKTETCFLW
ncbi:hypothetical protein PGB90_001960 [Kerria lacca]